MPQADEAVKDEVVDSTVVAPAAPEQDGSKEQVTEVTQTDNGEYTADNLKPDSSEEVTLPETDEPDESQSQSEELAPKSVNRFQKLANENRELKEQIERLKSQEDQVATEQGLLNEVNPETGEYYTVQEIERLAFAQTKESRAEQLAQERYDLEVQQNQQTITSETTKALEDFPIFDEKSKDYNPKLTALAEQRLAKSMIFAQDEKGQPVLDQQGNRIPIGANDSPYEILQTIAVASQSNNAKLKAEAQRSTEQQLARADSTGSSQQGDASFEKLPLKEMEAKLRRQGYDI